VQLDPFVAVHLVPVLHVKRADESASREAGGVDGDYGFYGLERKAACGDDRIENGRQVLIIEIVAHRIEAVRTPDEISVKGIPLIAGEVPRAKASIDLEGCAEHHAGQRQAGPPIVLWRLRDGAAEGREQGEEPRLFHNLRCVAGCPALLVADADCFGNGRCAVRLRQFLGRVFNRGGVLDGPDVLALRLTNGMVRAGAVGNVARQIDGIGVIIRLRRHEPPISLLLQCQGLCDLLALLLP
jgi:hypothetical protein